MRGNNRRAARARHTAGGRGAYRRAGLFALLLLALAAPAMLVGQRGAGAAQRGRPSKARAVTITRPESRGARKPAAPAATPTTTADPSTAAPTQSPPADADVNRENRDKVTSSRVKSVSATKVNMKQLAARDAAAAASVWRGKVKPRTTLRAIHAPLTIPEAGTPAAQGVTSYGGGDIGGPAPSAQGDAGGPSAPSPAPSASYLAQEDSPKVGTGVFTVPPDTMGAVGHDKVFVNVNNNYRVQDKTTGAPLSTVSIDTFWAATGAAGVFDPRVVFDPYQNRWLLSAVSNAQTANSSVLVGVSHTPDPQGTYTLFRFIVGCTGGTADCDATGEWADFPMLGFNKNWVAVGWNQFTISTSNFVAGKMLVLDYPALRAGTADGTFFNNASAEHGFCMHPATTLSPTEETLYVPVHQQSAGALYRLHKITGTAADPAFALDATLRVRPGGGWTQPGGDSLPQQCVPGVGLPTQTCPPAPRGLDASDAFIRSNVVFRNGRIWYPQGIALPAGGFINADTRFAAQWTALNPDGSFADGGRVEDATATRINGGRHYAYASIGVNKNGDVLLGFSEFESDDYVDAGYAFRLGTDAAGTMREPVIYKEGEDYYQKTFSGSRNRWGDYSHTVVDPLNDRDMWTIQEYAQLRVGASGEGTNDSRWGTWWAKVTAPAGAGDLLISEFRLRGPGADAVVPSPDDAFDEFIEIYNNNNTPTTVNTLDGSAGYSVVASDGVTRFTIPNGTTIPARGHYLGVNSAGYSLSAYPAGNGTTATGDAAYTTNIPDNAGIALFNTSNSANFTAANRLDAVGSTAEANALYKEGAGYTALTPSPINYSLYRDMCGKAGSITSIGPCPTGGFPKDTNDNASDFVFVDPSGASSGAVQRLGAPGPENLTSPVQRNDTMPGFLLDATRGSGSPPNRVRDFTSDPANNSTFGTLDLRRRVVNGTGLPVTRLRFRVFDVTTFPAPPGIADLRPRTSTAVVVSGVEDPLTCPGGVTPCTVTVQGTMLEEPPAQPNGGGFNSSLSAGTVTLPTPIPPGGSVNVRFLLGIQQTGTFKFFINIDVLP